MSIGIIILMLVVLTFVFILSGIPIYVSLLFSGSLSLVALGLTSDTPIATLAVANSIFTGIGNLPLLAIPFFMLAGEIMNRGLITEKLVRFAMLLIGRLPGSLAQAGIMSSMFFGGITGSAQACSSCIGGILIPAMKKEGYPPAEAVGVIASASTCGPIIPPSIIMVVYATAVGCSVGTMFMAGVVPGLLCGLVLMGIVLLRDRVVHFPRRLSKADKKEAIAIIVDAIIPLGMPIIVVGGIMGGVMTPTESGAIAVAYALLVSLFVIKTIKINEVWSILLQGVNSSAPLLLIIACAKVFSYGLTALQMPVIVNDFILSIIDNKYMFLLMVNIFLLIMGMFMDGGASVIILAPILAPVAASMDISLVHFGIIMCFNLTIGNITPPLGYCLFITAKIAGIPVEKAVKGTMPYMIAEFLTLMLITYVPLVVLGLPIYLGMSV